MDLGRQEAARKAVIGLFGLGLIVIAIALAHGIWEVWPAVEEVAARGSGAADRIPDPSPLTNVDLFMLNLDLSEGQAYLALILVLGMAGSFIHAATSFTTYVGNENFKLSWGWWYLLRPFVGGAVALVLVLAVLGGLVTISSNGTNVDPQSFNPYTVAALAGLAGWFSKTAADKLQEIFETILQNAKDDLREDKLNQTTTAAWQGTGRTNPPGVTPPSVTGIQPRSVRSGATDVEANLSGTGFATGATVIADSAGPVTATVVSPTELQLVVAGPISTAVRMQVVNTDGGQSDIFELGVS